ncbi:TonB-dependent receptor plug domain-containing protein [Chitinimonas lacunae]|uniref:TonB-dependent receptor plug domain-containing protein n=1 Tax=Chitinimonas lacunae TaxID=1963018 RepID=A0ABV8MQ76_9NEIS
MKLKRVALAIAAIGCVGANAWAEEVQQAEKIEVTGTSIKRIAKEGALPVQVFRRDEIQKTGATSAAELLQKLPAIQGFTASSEAVGGGGGGFAGASLHNIGESRTLVLVNGRRVASWAGQTITGAGAGIDLNTLPLATIERIEVLSDGASALYGSDAVAGVINFILRKKQTEGEVFGSYIKPQDGGGEEARFNITKGFGDLSSDGFNVLLSYSHDEQKLLKSGDRDFAKTGLINFSYGGKRYQFFNGSPRGIPANIAVDGYLVSPYYKANGQCPANHLAVTDIDPTTNKQYVSCYFDYISSVEILPESKRDNALVSVSKTLGANHTLFADLIWSRFELTSRIAPSVGDVPIPTTSPFYHYARDAGATGNVTAHWRLYDAGHRTNNNETEAKHVTVGMKGLIGGWDYETAYTHSVNDWTETHEDGWLKGNELLAALNSGKLNPFVGIGQQSNEGMSLIRNAQNRGLFKAATSKLDFVDFHASGELFQLGGGAAMLGAGIDYRRESTDYRPSAMARGVGNFIVGDSSSEVAFLVKRHAWGAFGELALPVMKDLELTAALRHDRYSDFGSTTNYKLAARYQPSRSMLLRGSIGSGFRAPSVPQTAPILQSYGVTGSPYACPFGRNDPLSQYCPAGEVQYDQFAGGNPDLKPEKSRQWAFGFRIEPSNEVSFGMDIWNVVLRDTIGQLTEDVVFGDPVRYRQFFSLYNDPLLGQQKLAVSLLNTNLGEQRTRGIDFDGRVGTKLPIGRLVTALAGTYMLKNDFQRPGGDEYYSNLGRYSDGAVTFRWQAKLSTTLEHGAWAHTLGLNYKSRYWDQPQNVEELGVNDRPTGRVVNVVRRVHADLTTDWQTRFQAMKNLSLTLGILNVFDRDPPLSIKSEGGQQLGFDNRYSDARGRTFYGNVTFKF